VPVLVDEHEPRKRATEKSRRRCRFFEGKKGIKKLPSHYFYQFYIAAVSWELT
jgi:hypothetical protein